MKRWSAFALGLFLLASCATEQPQANSRTTAAPTAVQARTAAAIAPSQAATLAPTQPLPVPPTQAPGVPVTQAPAPRSPARQEFAVPAGSHPHDVAPAPDGTVWYTAQAAGALGRLDPETGETHQIALGDRSAPHGVIVGPDGAPWITDSGLNAIVRVDPASEEVKLFPLPAERSGANLNTAAFDTRGILWFTGQSGIYGRLDPSTGKLDVFDAPRGRGPYGITATPSGEVYYASLAGSHIARIDSETGQATPIDPPTAGQGARRAWSDSQGRIWVSEWNAGQVGMYDPRTQSWREWK